MRYSGPATCEMARLKIETLNRLELALRRPLVPQAPAIPDRVRRKRSDTAPVAAVEEILRRKWGLTEPKGVPSYGLRFVNDELRASGRVRVSHSTATRAWYRLYRSSGTAI